MLSSTLLNPTSAPEFPADLTALNESLIPHARRERQHSCAFKDIVDTKDDQSVENYFHKDVFASCSTDRIKSETVSPELYKNFRRETNPFFDKVLKMQEASRRYREVTRIGNSPESGLGLTLESGGSASDSASSLKETKYELSSKTLALLKSLLSKATLVNRRDERVRRADIWNNYAPLLSAVTMDRRLENLEAAIDSLNLTTRNANNIAVFLRQPPTNGLRLDKRYHDAAARVLGPESLETMLTMVGALGLIDEFVNQLKDKENDKLYFDLARNLDEERSALQSMVDVVRAAVKRS